MNTSTEGVRQALLELGMEDWIPLPEAAAAPEVVAAAGEHDPMEVVRDALDSLLRTGELRVYLGPWDAESQVVPTVEALRMIREPRWYRYRLDVPHEERLSFVNVANDRGHHG